MLVTLVPDDRADLDHARRRLAYDRLVLLTGPAEAAIARAVAESENNASGRGQDDGRIATVLPLPDDGPHEVYAALERILDRHEDDHITVNAAGGTPAQLIACLMLAYERGIETLFVQHGHITRLPILADVGIEARFPGDEAVILATLAAIGEESATLARRIGLPRTAIDRHLRALRMKGAITLTYENGTVLARHTPAGTHFAAHLVRIQTAARR